MSTFRARWSGTVVRRAAPPLLDCYVVRQEVDRNGRPMRVRRCVTSHRIWLEPLPAEPTDKTHEGA